MSGQSTDSTDQLKPLNVSESEARLIITQMEELLGGSNEEIKQDAKSVERKANRLLASGFAGQSSTDTEQGGESA
jgi:hypothetical protein